LSLFLHPAIYLLLWIQGGKSGAGKETPMTDRPDKTKRKPGSYMCEVCRCKVTKEEAEHTSYLHCGRKMTEMEVIYMSDPSPSGP
jgi:hypothetical protein